MSEQPIWTPSTERIRNTQLLAFMQQVQETSGHRMAGYSDLYHWSLHDKSGFWGTLWDRAGVVADARGETVLTHGDSMEQAQWFPDARLNYAENLLNRGNPSQVALIYWDETGFRRSLTYRELRRQVSAFAQALIVLGVEPEDRIAGFLPNLPETVVAMLASSAVGAIWSACSPDFGVDGTLDRLAQINPRVLIAADRYQYNGKQYDCLPNLKAITDHLPTLDRVVLVSDSSASTPIETIPNAVFWDKFLIYSTDPTPFLQLPFDHPLFILFSSGTTGTPKGIVHGAGGTLLQHLKEHRLHTDLYSTDVLFYYTTCGWMMWNWLVSGLATGATLVLYDGAPTAPDTGHLWKMAQAEHVTVFGTSARYIAALQKAHATPGRAYDLSRLHTVLSTGSPLLPEHYDYVYREIKTDLLLGSISGGTDIISCFALGCPIRPVYRGELQCRGLGMAVDVVNEQGESVTGEKGELVCRQPFPSMPIGFWGDPDGERYHRAYFSRYSDIWAHGDYAEITEHDGIILHGRSDTVLNPGGVRIGTAEIYRQVEKVEEVIESVAIGQPREGTERIVLFVRLRDGLTLDNSLRQRIRDTVRQNATPRHVPSVILQVPDIPRTQSGKIVEIAVKNTVLGIPVTNQSALTNPASLAAFADHPELQDQSTDRPQSKHSDG